MARDQVEQQELNAILMQNLIELMSNKQGQTNSDGGEGTPKKESNKEKN